MNMLAPSSQPAPRRLTCNCCDGDAGIFQQHYNRDDGYGICVKCVELARADGVWEEEIESLFGVEGVNWGAPSREPECALIRVTVDYLQGYGESFPDLDRALAYAIAEVEKDLKNAQDKNSEPAIEGITAEDETGTVWVLVRGNGYRWEDEGKVQP